MDPVLRLLQTNPDIIRYTASGDAAAIEGPDGYYAFVLQEPHMVTSAKFFGYIRSITYDNFGCLNTISDVPYFPMPRPTTPKQGCIATQTEADPSGLAQHAPGAKLDAGKPRVGLVLGGFSRALMEVVKVGTAGAAKYTDNGWLEVENGVARYTDALGRHLLYEAQGEVIDPDFGLHHAAHAAWDALARLELMLIEQEKNTDL